MEAMLDNKASNDVNYVRPQHLEENKVQYLNHLNREQETVWGEHIEIVTVNVPIMSGIREVGREDIPAVKIGHLYFYVKDEKTPNHPFNANELKALLLEGDIGCMLDERMVKEGYCYEGGDAESPMNFFDQLFVSIGAAPFLPNCHEWQICL